MTYGLQGVWRPVGADHHPVVDVVYTARRAQGHDLGLLGLSGRAHEEHRDGADAEQHAGEDYGVGSVAAEHVLEDPTERHGLDEHGDVDHHVDDAHVHAQTSLGHHAGDQDVGDAHHGSPGDA